MLPRATTTRTTREASQGKVGGRTMEIQRLIGRSMRTVVRLPDLGERTIWIDCDVIQADGGTRTASITGAFVALVLALERMKQQDQLRSIPIKDYVAATSVGVVAGMPLLDLAYEEDAQAEVDMNIVKTGDGRFIEIQGTAEAEPFGSDALAGLFDLADRGITELIAKQREIVGPILGRLYVRATESRKHGTLLFLFFPAFGSSRKVTPPCFRGLCVTCLSRPSV